MAEHDYNIGNQSFPGTRSDINNAFAAIVSNNSKATEPTVKFAYMLWYDTTNNILKQRNAANGAWIDIGYFDQTNGKFVARIHETVTKAAAYTTVATDRNKTILANANSAGFTITLLPAATAGSGFVQTIKKTDATANVVTIDGNGSETIDGALTSALSSQYDTITIISDGTNWHKVSPSVAAASTSTAGVVTKATAAQVVSETADKYADAATLKNHQGIVKAWVRFNGTGTVAIEDSYNVTSITDNGTGDYTVNITSSFANANYCIIGNAKRSIIDEPATVSVSNLAAPTTSTCRIITAQNSTKYDSNYVSVAFFGDI